MTVGHEFCSLDNANPHLQQPPELDLEGFAQLRVERAERLVGVVDGWGRAHEVPNLFIADGSQFATGGAANPTLTIVALAIRQAEFIARAMTAGEL